MDAVGAAARAIRAGDMDLAIAGGVESISLRNQDPHPYGRDAWLVENKPAVYMSMLETADIVAARYGVTREAQDELALESQKRTAAAQANGVTVAFESAVAGGIPIIKAIREGLAGNRIEWLAGIINGTGNFILTEMRDKGRAFEDVLKVSVFVKDMLQYSRINAVYSEYFKPETAPARELVEVANLPKFVNIEISVIAAVK